jgi:hypothetical protein
MAKFWSHFEGGKRTGKELIDRFKGQRERERQEECREI